MIYKSGLCFHLMEKAFIILPEVALYFKIIFYMLLTTGCWSGIGLLLFQTGFLYTRHMLAKSQMMGLYWYLIPVGFIRYSCWIVISFSCRKIGILGVLLLEGVSI